MLTEVEYISTPPDFQADRRGSTSTDIYSTCGKYRLRITILCVAPSRVCYLSRWFKQVVILAITDKTFCRADADEPPHARRPLYLQRCLFLIRHNLCQELELLVRFYFVEEDPWPLNVCVPLDDLADDLVPGSPRFPRTLLIDRVDL